MEDQVDAEMRKLETMDEDDLEALKKRRIEMMKKQQEKKQEWLAQGHGEYSEIPEEKVRPPSLMGYYSTVTVVLSSITKLTIKPCSGVLQCNQEL